MSAFFSAFDASAVRVGGFLASFAMVLTSGAGVCTWFLAPIGMGRISGLSDC